MKAIIPIVRGRVCLLLLAGVVSGQAAMAQSAGNQTHTYDTTLTSDGFGIYHLNIPQFNPDSGTLVSIHISAQTNTMYGFTLRNADSVASTYSLTVGVQDEFTSTALPATYSNVQTQSLGNFPLNAGQELSQSPMSVLQNHVSTDTVTAVATFLGTGQVNLQYQAFTFTNLNAVNNASYYYSAGINNTMTFSVKYLFSKAGVLETNLTAWSAMAFGPRHVQLDWAATDETAGRQYVIQRGTNDNQFEDVATIPATADRNTAQYQFPDELPAGADHAQGNAWYYRLRIVDATGLTTYSPVRVVSPDAGNEQHIQVYPNPATDFINVVPDKQETADWQVDIVSAAGIVVQRNVFMSARTMTVNFQNRLAAGTYFVRALDLNGKQTVMSTFIVPGPR